MYTEHSGQLSRTHTPLRCTQNISRKTTWQATKQASGIKKTEVIGSTFSGHSGMKLAIWKTIKFTNTYKLTHSTNGSKREISKILKEK